MARQNPYQMDPFLAQGFSSLTKALIGDAETDYQVARTGYQNAQTNRTNKLLPFEIESEKGLANQRNSTASNQSSQAGFYDARTAEQAALNEAATTLSSDPTFQGAAAAVLGLPDGATLTPEALQALALTAISGGNPDQRSSALSNIGASGQNIRAGEMILDGSDSDAQRGALFKAPQGGQFQNPAFAGEQLADTLQNNIDVQDLENKSATDVANIQATSNEKIAGMDNTAQAAWEEYKADRQKEADIRVQELKNTQSGAEAAAKLEAEIQWESENNIIVEDGVMVFSPDAAKKYGVTNQVNVGTDENPEMMFSIDVSRNNKNGVAVTIEGTDQTIYLDQQYFDKFNVINKGGTFVIPEGAVNPPSGSKGNPPSVNNTNASSYNELLNIAIDKGGVNLPPQMKQDILAEASKAQQDDNSVIAGQNVINQKLTPIIVEDGWTSDIITYPAIIDKIDEILQVVPEANQSAAAIEALQTEFRYSADAAQKIYQYMLRR